MGLGMSRLNMVSCGPFRRTSSELQDPSNYTRLMVDRDNHDNAASSVVVNSRNTSQGQKNSSSLPMSRDVVSSSLPKKDVVSSSLPKKDVVSSSLPKEDVAIEEKNAHVNNIYQQLDEESEKNTKYNGPMFMKSPSFRDFVRLDDSVKNGGKKEGEMRENDKAEATGPVCNGEVCMRGETKNETPVENKEAGNGKEKRIYKMLSQAKPSTVSGGMKNLFYHPKHPKPSN